MNNFKKIGVCAPSSYVEKNDIDAAAAFLATQNIETFIHPQTFARHNQSAGTVQEKLKALHELYKDSSIDCIWAAGGGNRSLQLLDHLDYDLIRSNAKPMIGFSDTTALLNAITVKTDIINIHGPIFKNIHKYQNFEDLFSESTSMPLNNSKILKPGSAEGIVFGGNLSIFQYLPETLSGNWLDGAILCLEDCNEELSRIDRMFIHLKRLGVFNHINALILGEFTDLQDSTRPFGFSLEDIILEHTDDTKMPIIMNAPFGHGQSLHPFIIGKTAFLDTKNKTLQTDFSL